MDTDIAGTQTTLLSHKGGKIAECFVNYTEKKQESRVNQELPRSSENIQKEGKQLKLRRKLGEVPLLSHSYLPGAQPEMDFSIVDFGKIRSHQEVHSPSSWVGALEREDWESLSNTFSRLGKKYTFYKMLQYAILIAS